MVFFRNKENISQDSQQVTDFVLLAFAEGIVTLASVYHTTQEVPSVQCGADANKLWQTNATKHEIKVTG